MNTDPTTNHRRPQPRAARPAARSGIALLLVTLAAAIAAPTAGAASPANGKALYNNTPGGGGISCANASCHGPDPTQNNNNVQRGANNPTVIQNAITNNKGGMGMFQGVLSAADIADIAAYIGNPAAANGPNAAVAPAALSFAATAVGATSASQTVTLSNTGAAALSISAIAISTAEFTHAGGTCAAGGSVAVNASCTVLVAFKPGAAGARSATLSITHSAANSPSSVSLSGTGSAAAPTVGVAPVALSFGSTVLGQQSAAQTVTVSNTGSGALQFTAIATNSADFAVAGGTCAVGTPVAAATGSCTVLLKFKPQAAGARSGTLTLTDNAASASTVALSGTGVAATPVAQLAPASLTFSQTVGSASAPQTLTLSNTGTAPLALSAVTLGGAAAADYAVAAGSTCAAGGSVAAGASCVVQIVFTPAAQGARSATLTVTHNAAGGASQAALDGTGTAAPTPQVSVNAVTLAFPAQSVNTTSAAKTLTVSNSGSALLTFSGVSIGGADAGDFAVAAGTSCTAGSTLAVGASCTIDVTFRPTVSSGTRSATLNITSDAGNGSVAVGLSGAAAPAAAPAVSFAPASLDLGSEAVGTASAARTVTLSNTGTAALAIAGLSASPAEFSLTHNCPASLAAAASCTLSLRFTPAAVGPLNGAVTLLSNAATSPDALALTGTGVQAPATRLGWSGATGLSFPDTAVGTPGAAQSITLSNLGNAAATLQQIRIAGADAADFALDPSGTCTAGATLPAAGSCSIAVVFAPTAAGARSASLDVVSDATAPAPASLSGTGVAGGLPVLSVSPGALSLTGPVNGPLQPQALVVTNSGAGVLQVTAVQAPAPVEVMNAAMPGGGTCPPPPFSLQPGLSCTLMVGASGPVNATLQLSSNASATPATVSVTATPLGNAGGGGCSIGPPGRPADPVWALLLGAAAAVLWRRRAQAARCQHRRN